MTVLRLEDIEHAYGTEPAVRGVTLELGAGEIVSLVGPSGCGKTTMLRLAAGLERLRGGAISLSGETVADTRTHAPPEARDVGLVFQDYALFPHLDVASNVGFGLGALSTAERDARVDDMLQLVGLSHLAGRFPHALSGGEQQRVALVRALAPRPKVLLLDEPFSGLDAAVRHRVREETRTLLREQGTATLLVTHDGDEALQLGDRVALMRDGELVQHGSGEDLYLHPVDAFAARFFGEVNELDAVVKEGVVSTPFGSLPAGDLTEGSTARVLFRPESLQLVDDGTTVARVEDSRILCGHRATVVTLENESTAPRRLEVRHDIDESVSAGDRVGLRLVEGGAWVFAAP
ncbi:MAG: ABC transporter ATP-binding protein [Acidobacteriota bacterium]